MLSHVPKPQDVYGDLFSLVVALKQEQNKNGETLK